LLKLKVKKKEVDKDSSLLRKRISLLQNEEDKILKKIQKTRERAD